MSAARNALGRLRLGVNIDHVATVRNARGGWHPDPVRAATLAERAGADGIVAHLREDRRHITDTDIERLMRSLRVPLNLEMAATAEMRGLALRYRPHAVCLVPERRAELTTEGGLNVVSRTDELKPLVGELGAAGIRVSLFIDPEAEQIAASRRVGAPVIELHTGAYAQAAASAPGEEKSDKESRAAAGETARLVAASRRAAELGLEVHAGHGLTFANVGPVAAIPEIVELNIGHFLVGEAMFVGLEAAIGEMRRSMARARAGIPAG